MKRLLVLSYYFPPRGHSGVQRVLKLAKYLPRFGWQPVIVTTRAAGTYAYDPALLGETDAPVVRTFSLDPLYLSPTAHDPGRAARRGTRAGRRRWIIPDNKIGWTPFAVRAGIRAARQHQVGAILSSAPPYSSHLAGIILKRVLRKPLILDFRDAWTGYTWGAYPTALHRALDRFMESRCLRGSDLVLGVNQSIVDELRDSCPDLPRDRFRLLSHGYDPEDFLPVIAPDRGHFTIVHTGTFINHRGPGVLLRALGLIRSASPGILGGINVIFAGAHRAEDATAIRDAGLVPAVTFTGYLPHADSVRLLQRASALWLVMGAEETANVTPGKLFEYLGARKPILASIPAGGAAAKIILETGAGQVFPPDDAAGLAAAISELVRLGRAGNVVYRGLPGAVDRYDRRLIASQLAAMLDSLAPDIL